jgi:transposase-like protein
MKRKRFGVEQIAYAITQAEGGTAVAAICRQMGVSEPTFYRWRKRYSGLTAGQRLLALAAHIHLRPQADSIDRNHGDCAGYRRPPGARHPSRRA